MMKSFLLQMLSIFTSGNTLRVFISLNEKASSRQASVTVQQQASRKRLHIKRHFAVDGITCLLMRPFCNEHCTDIQRKMTNCSQITTDIFHNDFPHSYSCRKCLKDNAPLLLLILLFRSTSIVSVLGHGFDVSKLPNLLKSLLWI